MLWIILWHRDQCIVDLRTALWLIQSRLPTLKSRARFFRKGPSAPPNSSTLLQIRVTRFIVDSKITDSFLSHSVSLSKIFPKRQYQTIRLNVEK
jgi:hypothetical protein